MAGKKNLNADFCDQIRYLSTFIQLQFLYIFLKFEFPVKLL